jgi:hypothetical protein
MGRAGPRSDLGEAKFEVQVAQQQRKDLALLLGAQDSICGYWVTGPVGR